MQFHEDDLVHVMRMVFPENKGNILTEAMMMGLEQSILHYLRVVTKPESQPGVEVENGS
jgi:hypothetical protein